MTELMTRSESPGLRLTSTIRDATIDDRARIDEIFNFYVQTTELTFDLEPRSQEAGEQWLLSRGREHPVLVYEDSMLRAWSSLSRWSVKAGYDPTVELSIFVEPESRGHGIGRRLMAATVQRAVELNHHCILSRITAGNEASIRLHEAVGFERIGLMREVGRKHGRWLDVALYQKLLATGD